MSQSIQNEEIYNKVENKETNNSENIYMSDRGRKRQGTFKMLQKIKEHNNNGVHQEFSKQFKSNGYDKVNSLIDSIVNPNKDNKDDDLNNGKENNNEGQNNGADKFNEKNSYIDNMRNPYKDYNNDEANNESKNNGNLSLEKEVFYSQVTIMPPGNEQNKNQVNINIPQNDNTDNEQKLYSIRYGTCAKHLWDIAQSRE